MNNKEIKVEEEVAIADIKKFVEHYTDEDIEDADVKENYSKTLKAVKVGLLTFGDDGLTASYKLDEPIMTTAGEVAVDTITFNTRIKADKRAELMKGIDPKSFGEYSRRAFAYIIKQPAAMINKLGRFDEKLLQEFCGVFM